MTRTRSVLSALAFAVVLALSGVRLLAHLNVPGTFPPDRWALQDFRDAIYYPTVAVLAGTNPYDSADYQRRYPVGQTFPAYAPTTFALHLPFALLPPRAAGLAYAAACAAMTVLLAYLSLRFVRPSPSAAATLGVATLLLLSRPGHWNFMLGQYAATMSVGVYLALLCARRRPWVAAGGLALATIKPTFGVPLALLLLARGDVAAVVRGLALAVLGGLITGIWPLWAAGGIARFAALLPANVAAFAGEPSVNPLHSLYRVDAVVPLARLLGRVPSDATALAVGVMVLVLGALAVRRLAANEVPTGTRPISASAICAVLAVCTYHLSYDFLLLTLPAVWLVAGWRVSPLVERPRLRAVLAVALLIAFGNHLASEGAVAWLGLSGVSQMLVTGLNSLAALAVVGAYLMLAARVRVPRVAIALAGAAVLALAGWSWRHAALSAAAGVLIAEDAPARADLAVMSLAMPRAAAFEAARLYRDGLVPRLAVFRWEHNGGLDQAVRDLGVPQMGASELAATIAARLGVPADAIELLPERVDGTGSEIAALARLAQRRRLVAVTLITGRVHSARARWLLARALPAGTRGMVRVPREDDFDAAAWWRTREQARQVLDEYLRWANTLVLRDAWATPPSATLAAREEVR
jgi:uncharacterized SAM-binding protein YcdF (DUF218 family)